MDRSIESAFSNLVKGVFYSSLIMVCPLNSLAFSCYMVSIFILSLKMFRCYLNISTPVTYPTFLSVFKFYIVLSYLYFIEFIIFYYCFVNYYFILFRLRLLCEWRLLRKPDLLLLIDLTKALFDDLLLHSSWTNFRKWNDSSYSSESEKETFLLLIVDNKCFSGFSFWRLFI